MIHASRPAIYIAVSKLYSDDTFRKIQQLKEEGYKITSAIPDVRGKIVLVAERIFGESFILPQPYYVVRSDKPRSFSI